MLGLDDDALLYFVVPTVEYSSVDLENAKDAILSISIPSDFSCATELRSIPNAIDLIIDKNNNTTKWLVGIVGQFMEAENKNFAMVDYMNYMDLLRKGLYTPEEYYMIFLAKLNGVDIKGKTKEEIVEELAKKYGVDLTTEVTTEQKRIW